MKTNVTHQKQRLIVLFTKMVSKDRGSENKSILGVYFCRLGKDDGRLQLRLYVLWRATLILIYIICTCSEFLSRYFFHNPASEGILTTQIY